MVRKRKKSLIISSWVVQSQIWVSPKSRISVWCFPSTKNIKCQSEMKHRKRIKSGVFVSAKVIAVPLIQYQVHKIWFFFQKPNIKYGCWKDNDCTKQIRKTKIKINTHINKTKTKKNNNKINEESEKCEKFFFMKGYVSHWHFPLMQ